MTRLDGADAFLGRVLRSEVDTASLLAYCAALDPEPLQRFLGIPEPITGVRVEVQHTGRSRLDVVLDGADGPLAVLELKVSATEHGDQLTRYEEYAAPHRAALFLLDLELPGARCPEPWRRENLADVFRCWESSASTPAKTFAAPIAAVFSRWTTAAHGAFEGIDPSMLSIVTRSVANALTASGLEAYSAGTAVGKPDLVAFAPHPSGVEGAFLCVDARCQDRLDTSRPWIFRLGIHVNRPDADENLGAARATAHDLALELEPALTLDALRTHLSEIRVDIAEAVSTKGPLRRPRDRDSAIADWLETAGTALVAPRHPIFFHDWGRRLAASFLIDLSALTPEDLGVAVRGAMDYLQLSAAAPAHD